VIGLESLIHIDGERDPVKRTRNAGSTGVTMPPGIHSEPLRICFAESADRGAAAEFCGDIGSDAAIQTSYPLG
jgi:hypothetical protein